MNLDPSFCCGQAGWCWSASKTRWNRVVRLEVTDVGEGGERGTDLRPEPD